MRFSCFIAFGLEWIDWKRRAKKSKSRIAIMDENVGKQFPKISETSWNYLPQSISILLGKIAQLSELFSTIVKEQEWFKISLGNDIQSSPRRFSANIFINISYKLYRVTDSLFQNIRLIHCGVCVSLGTSDFQTLKVFLNHQRCVFAVKKPEFISRTLFNILDAVLICFEQEFQTMEEWRLFELFIQMLFRAYKKSGGIVGYLSYRLYLDGLNSGLNQFLLSILKASGKYPSKRRHSTEIVLNESLAEITELQHLIMTLTVPSSSCVRRVNNYVRSQRENRLTNLLSI